MHRMISKRETVTQINNVMAQFNEGMQHKRIKKEHLKSLSLKIQETTAKGVAITEKLPTLRNK